MAKALKKLTLLHSNDLHGDFLAEEVDHELVGGVSMLSGYINKVRQEEKNVIYAIAGDMFRGSVIDSEYKGISTIEIMNLLGPDIVTIGNHEIDYGVPHLLFIEKCAKFPIINANFYVRTTGTRLFQPCKVLKVGGMKILFIGIITQQVVDAARSDELIGTFLDVAEAAKEVGKICNAYNATDIDFTVLLTHIGHEEDKELAALLDPSWGVDVIIGGHSHTFLDEPAVVNGIPIVQAGTGTDQIGRFDIWVDTDRNCIDHFTWTTIPIDDEHCPKDEALEQLLTQYKGSTDQKYGRVLCRFPRKLTHPERNQETEVGNLFADILMESYGVDIALCGSGSLRHEQFGPIVTYGDLCEMFPYDDASYQIKLTGAQLERAIRRILRDEAWAGHTEFYQLSRGMHVKYCKSTRELLELTFQGEPIDPNRIYSVCIQKFHFVNTYDFLRVTPEEFEANGAVRVLSTSCRDVVEEYMVSHSFLDAHLEGRWELLD
ncbi:MAG: bifunctional metallophosphatase/5'-nucleotidase [Coriobacteriales bacterium]|nr:bifunctional metallophosphatase/5'-nucleotidase [Coriobacteriales bacterium]MBQ6586586.1 bifunctional metallophosphatase/5'-nucleotidase [Coriobacteriales bacterium]